MSQLLRRPEVAKLLGVSERTSYRIIPAPASGSKIVRSDAFIKAVNFAAAYNQPTYDETGFAPWLETPETLAFHFGVTPSQVRNWTRRAVNPCPHFHFGGSLIRFDRETVEQWTRGITKYTTRKPRK